jgi:hypothetical protein
VEKARREGGTIAIMRILLLTVAAFLVVFSRLSGSGSRHYRESDGSVARRSWSISSATDQMKLTLS